jgi:hypothetical protein
MDTCRLEHVLRKSKSTFGWKYIKESKHAKDEELVNQ